MAPSHSLLVAMTLLSSLLSVNSHSVNSHIVLPEIPSQQLASSVDFYPQPKSDNACKLPAPVAGYLSEGFVPAGSYNRPSAPTTGTMNAKLLFVDFEDAPANDTTQSLYDSLVTGSIAWFNTSSYGALTLNVDADMSKFYRMPQASTKYTFKRFKAKQDMYIRDALSVEKGNYAGKKYDVLYIVPTRKAEEISYSPTKLGTSKAPGGGSFPNAVTFGQDLHLKYGFKLLNHETGHVMGLPDLCKFSSFNLLILVGHLSFSFHLLSKS
jgi:hypothetical protein